MDRIVNKNLTKISGRLLSASYRENADNARDSRSLLLVIGTVIRRKSGEDLRESIPVYFEGELAEKYNSMIPARENRHNFYLTIQGHIETKESFLPTSLDGRGIPQYTRYPSNPYLIGDEIIFPEMGEIVAEQARAFIGGTISRCMHSRENNDIYYISVNTGNGNIAFSYYNRFGLQTFEVGQRVAATCILRATDLNEPQGPGKERRFGRMPIYRIRVVGSLVKTEGKEKQIIIRDSRVKVEDRIEQEQIQSSPEQGMSTLETLFAASGSMGSEVTVESEDRGILPNEETIENAQVTDAVFSEEKHDAEEVTEPKPKAWMDFIKKNRADEK